MSVHHKLRKPPSTRAIIRSADKGAPREVGPSLKKLSKAEARDKYNHYTGNHPTIHCNRFPAWEDLSKADKRKWRDPLYRPWLIETERDDTINKGVK